MLSLTISFIIGLAISSACIAADVKSGSIAYGILGFIISQVLISLIVRRRLKKVNAELQEIMEAGQKRIMMKVNQFQMKPGGNPKILQRQIEKDQQELFKQALDFTDRLEAFKKWNPLMNKQLSTMRLQFLYQLKEFKKVDAILSKGFFTGPIFSDPMLAAMKMARQYKHDDIKGAEKTFRRYVKWFRNDGGALLYGLMSWILIKQDRAEEALDLLAKAKDKMFNETINRNWEALSNNRPKSFSNAGFGDQWYSLHLEKLPAPKKQRVRPGGKGGHRPF